MNRYGIPYQGSKNAIAAHIVAEFLPPSACLVDIFSGRWSCYLVPFLFYLLRFFNMKYMYII